MKKSLILLSAAAIIALTGCTSAEKPMKEMVITETENQFVMEDIDVSKKTLEELIVFNEEGVTIRKEGNNLVLSMPELVLFDFNKYEVKNKVKGSLNTLAKALEENPDIRIKIDGYTDFIGSEGYNLELSVKRAKSIRNYLVDRGVKSSNISIEGYGKQNPIANNATAAGRAKNRRVEFIISRDSL
ncbi:OmpA family protein [uncultured Fusobacterium sp.]|jgi:outer membrane protein OmpA-like peptidoglycan-associated protein|uniref:OmpA family protein n=1 Tax=uncultured Fusobacterium sp. TaxID=159267 RepID=UPI0025D3DBA6|nr:OmpA family protein [uncultured Fusobacterium sp.]